MTVNSSAAPTWVDALAPITDGEVRLAIRRLFDDARAWVYAHSDSRPLIVLVSRRMCCLYEMLCESGMPELGGEVVYDRALDANPKDWGGRPTRLVDDVCVFGSTLADRCDEIVQLIGDESLLVVDVACVDRDRHSRLLRRRLRVDRADTQLVERSTKQIEELALNIASSLYQGRTPYFTDFPLLRPLRVRTDEAHGLVRSGRWLAADVTARLIAAPGQEAYSLIPTELTDRHVRRRGLDQAMQVADLIKVRMWLTPHDDDGHSWLRIIPLVIPCPMMERPLDELLSAIEVKVHEFGRTGLEWDNWKPSAKHRLLQMYLSTCLLDEFFEDIRKHCPSISADLAGDLLIERHVDGYFGRSGRDAVLRAFTFALALGREPRSGHDHLERGASPVRVRSGLGRELVVRRHLLSKVATAVDPPVRWKPPPRPGRQSVAKVDGIWAQHLIDVFGLVDEVLERDQQRRLRALLDNDEAAGSTGVARWSDADAARYNETYGAFREGRLNGFGERVLHKGITLAEIEEILQPYAVSSDVWSRAVTSFALDIANDLGVAVPSTVCVHGDRPDVPRGSRGPVYRQYRSGENAPVVRQPLRELVGHSAADALEQMDDLTVAALGLASRCWSDLTAHQQNLVNQFLQDNARVNGVAVDGRSTYAFGLLEQHRVGSVRKITSDGFEADVYSLTDLTADSALLPLGWLPSASSPDDMIGAEFDWRIYRLGASEEPIGGPPSHGRRQYTEVVFRSVT